MKNNSIKKVAAYTMLIIVLIAAINALLFTYELINPELHRTIWARGIEGGSSNAPIFLGC